MKLIGGLFLFRRDHVYRDQARFRNPRRYQYVISAERTRCDAARANAISGRVYMDWALIATLSFGKDAVELWFSVATSRAG
ncbi:hypothetical protein Pla22_05820 [Rubripirellula amarantea]|uniref:Uncharacterized protein n=2 Tax=Rubripirellula amarantea TaxID=2527999 RepID=A0A5C5WPZ6_9BACT|nr:hypothetical protein Pla22_05820 [Rubripirellula amarantea]